MALQLYLIRHGRTEWNLEGRLQGTGDSPLVEEGIEGAKRTGQALADIPFVACYSSLMKRAQDTANYIIGGRDIPHFHHKGLNEFHFGLWEGKKSVDLVDHPEYILFKTQPALYEAKASQGQRVEDLYKQATKALEEIIRLHQHQENANILIVSHGMTLTLLTAVLKGLPWQDFRDPERHAFVANTAINVARVEAGKIELVAFNQQDHLA
ncbi:phosphoglycerate mutase [Pasteurellaceae bacterium RH1A]|nr:phosphoglycerate mutase [Pasteurellaceae bacterium RH1A]